MEAVIVCFMTAHLAVMGWLLLTVVQLQRSVDRLSMLSGDMPKMKKDVALIQEWRKSMANGHAR